MDIKIINNKIILENDIVKMEIDVVNLNFKKIDIIHNYMLEQYHKEKEKFLYRNIILPIKKNLIEKEMEAISKQIEVKKKELDICIEKMKDVIYSNEY